MQRAFTIMMLGGLALVQMPAVTANSQQLLDRKPTVSTEGASADLPALPPLPRGKSTILGGEIRNIDPVRDQFTLKVFGEKPMKILFDERTKIYRDGTRIPLRDLSLSEHASVQTTLDGANVFALSIHILSQSPSGEYQGRVVNYRPDTGELTIGTNASGETVRLMISKDTTIAREGQSGFSSMQSGIPDLVTGALISAEFKPGQEGRGIASHVEILATPGAGFVFSGNISTLDVSSGFLVLVDPRDGKSYRIFFDNRLSTSRDLHTGENVRVSADYDGVRYVASGITAD
jgi:hypothetical protein